MACVGLRQGVWSYLNLESILIYPFYIRLKKKKKNWAHKESVTYQGHKLANACLRFLTLKVKSLSRVRLFVTPWTVAYQSSLSMGFSRQEYWSGLPFPSPGDLPDPGIEPRSPALDADALTSEPPGKPKIIIIHLPTYKGWIKWCNLHHLHVKYNKFTFIICKTPLKKIF